MPSSGRFLCDGSPTSSSSDAIRSIVLIGN
jgi:hypothetical protein